MSHCRDNAKKEHQNCRCCQQAKLPRCSRPLPATAQQTRKNLCLDTALAVSNKHECICQDLRKVQLLVLITFDKLWPEPAAVACLARAPPRHSLSCCCCAAVADKARASIGRLVARRAERLPRSVLDQRSVHNSAVLKR